MATAKKAAKKASAKKKSTKEAAPAAKSSSTSSGKVTAPGPLGRPTLPNDSIIEPEGLRT